MSIRNYLGQSFDAGKLKHFSLNFYTSYRSCIALNADKVFLVCRTHSERKQITFREFDRDVRIVAGKIQTLPNEIEVFATRAGNSYLHIVHIFAILLSRKILFPINPAESLDFVSAQVEKIEKRAFIFDESNFFDLTKVEEVASSIDATTPLDADFIYVLTSGSTGHSKIVRQRQMGLLSNVEALIDHHNLNEQLTIGTCLPVFHVNALEFSLMCSFFSGNKLVLWERFEISNVCEQIKSEKVDIYSATPEILRIFAMKGSSSESARENLQQLKYFVSAASALSKQVVSQIQTRLGLRIIQGYGLSEAINFSAKLPTNITDDLYEKVMLASPYPSIGVELWGNSIFVLNDENVEMGEGEIGEVSIQGFNVMTSYVGDEPPVDFLRTGDLGFYLHIDGTKFFFISGRKKDAAKRFGETIPLRDVDDFFTDLQLMEFDCIAIAFKNSTSGEEIGMVCKPPKDGSMEWQNVFSAHLAKLPIHKRPKVVYVEKTDPLRTASGKPLRWKFAKHFSDYEEQLIGSNLLWIKGADSNS